MDMLPPQAPPAHTVQANQAALDALDRMADTQRWIVQQQDALPDLPAESEALDPFLAELDAFWEVPVEHAPGKPLVPRWQALALRLAQTTRDDASLRRNDGTLSDRAAALINAVALHPGGPLPDHLKARELLVGTVPYAGALVLQDERHPEQVLLFTTETGWESFDSLNTLYRDVEWRMREVLSYRDELPGVGMDDVEAVIRTHFLGTRPIGDAVFDTLARRLAARQRERVVLAWNLLDTLDGTLDLHRLLDLHAIVQHRDLALAAKRDEERLAVQPARIRDHWMAAATGYRDSWRQALDASLTAVPSLAIFVDKALTESLRQHGVDIPPQEIRVRVVRRAPDRPLANALSGFPHEDLSFTELAYRNLGSSPTEDLQVIHADGSPRDDVPASVLAQIVRDLDLPHRYAQHLDEQFGDTTEGRARRATIVALQKARMRFEAADARLGFYDLKEPRSFSDDSRERGFAWVNAILDHPHPSGRARVEGHEIVVRQLTYKDAPLAGVFLIGPRQVQAVSSVVLYTPDAPDGKAFREFSDRAELARNFLRSPTFETYLLDRLPVSFATVNAKGERHFDVTRLNDGKTLQWVLGAATCYGCTELGEHFQEREVVTSFLDVANNTMLSLAKRNAGDLARSTTAADVQSSFDLLGYADLRGQLFTEFFTGLIDSVPRAARASWRFYDHVKAGEYADAFVAFVDGYTAALNIMPLYTHVPVAAGSLVRAAPGSRTLVPTQRRLPPSETLFEKRFLANDVTPPAGPPPASGVYSVNGQRYIQQAGHMYRVNFDADIAGWRLSTPHSPASLKTGGPIERLANGSWQYRKVGLLGGSGRGAGTHAATLLEEVRNMLDSGTSLSPEVAVLTEPQRVVLIDTLRGSFRHDEFAQVLRHMVDRAPGQRIVLSSTQRQAWNQALELARGTPAIAGPSTSSAAASASSSLQALDLSARASVPAQRISVAANITESIRAMIGNIVGNAPHLGYPPNFREAARTLFDNTQVNPALLSLTIEQRGLLLASLRRRLSLHAHPLNHLANIVRHMAGRTPNPGALSAEHIRAWELSVAKARRTVVRPLPGQTLNATGPSAGPSAATLDIIPSTTTVPQNAWPAEAYMYASPQTIRSIVGTDTARIPQILLDNATDGIPLTTLPPLTPAASVPPQLIPLFPFQGGTTAATDLRSMYGAWIRVDLNRLAARAVPAGVEPLELLEVNGSTGRGFILRRNGPVMLTGDDFTTGFVPQ